MKKISLFEEPLTRLGVSGSGNRENHPNPLKAKARSAGFEIGKYKIQSILNSVAI